MGTIENSDKELERLRKEKLKKLLQESRKKGWKVEGKNSYTS